MTERQRNRKEARQVARHSEKILFTVWVLWVIGFSEMKIGSVVGRTRKQISGIVARSPYPNRSAMTRDERQKALEQLVKVRMNEKGEPLDGGILDRIPHKVIDLQGRQRKRGQAACR